MRFDLTTRIRSSLRWQTLSTLLTGFGNILLLLVLTRYLDKADFGLFALLALFVSFSGQYLPGVSGLFAFVRPVTSDRGFFSARPAAAAPPDIGAKRHHQHDRQYLSGPPAKEYAIPGAGPDGGRRLRFFFALSVLMAVYGYGVLTLVAANLLRTAILSALQTYFGRSIFRPRPELHLSDIRPLLSFARYQSGRFSFAYLAQRMDTLLIGKLYGEEWLGVYDVFKQVLERGIFMLAQPFGQVLLGAFSNLLERPKALARSFLLYSNLVFALQCFFFGGLVLAAVPLVDRLFGTSFASHADLFTWLAVFLLIWAFGIIPDHLLTVTGQVKRGMYWNLLQIPLLGGIFIGGGNALELTELVQILVLYELAAWLLYYLWVLKGLLPLPLHSYAPAFLRPLALTLLAAAPAGQDRSSRRRGFRW